MPIFVVMGSCGEYSDRTEWPVAWYPTREQADSHGDRAAEDVKRIENWLQEIGSFFHEHHGRSEEINAFDPQMQWSYTGASYFTLEVPDGWSQFAPGARIDAEVTP